MKRSQADNWFSKCIRRKYNYTCQRCFKVYPSNHAGLHCSHNFSRRHRTIRWCVQNALALCYSCHEWFGSNPYESGNWLESIMGRNKLDRLIAKKDAGNKVSKLEEKDIAHHYREQFKQLENDPLHKLESWQ